MTGKTKSSISSPSSSSSYFQSFLSLISASFIDEQHDLTHLNEISPSDRRTMATNESNSHIFTSALLLAVAIPTVIDAPTSGLFGILGGDPMDSSDGSYHPEKITTLG